MTWAECREKVWVWAAAACRVGAWLAAVLRAVWEFLVGAVVLLVVGCVLLVGLVGLVLVGLVLAPGRVLAAVRYVLELWREDQV